MPFADGADVDVKSQGATWYRGTVASQTDSNYTVTLLTPVLCNVYWNKTRVLGGNQLISKVTVGKSADMLSPNTWIRDHI